jgi:hypothetical protein
MMKQRKKENEKRTGKDAEEKLPRDVEYTS